MEVKNIPSEYWVNLLIDYLTGKITTEEEVVLLEWIERSEENKLYYTQLKEIWVSSQIGNPHTPFHKEKAFRMFRERVDAAVRNRQIKKKKIIKRVASIAVILLPFVILIYLGDRYMELKNTLADQQIIYTSVVAPKGGQSQVLLPDGTQVWLNAGSSLRYANTFGQVDRNLALSGEAYFDVATHKTLPFIVQSGVIKIQVLGTRFNVKSYEQLDNIKVALLEGSVSLQNELDNQTYMLEPLETAVYSKLQNKIEIAKDISYHANGWTNGDIIFTGERFEEIAFMLEQHFNVTIQIKKESLKMSRYNGDFTKNETIERIFNIMATDGQFSYKITGDHIDVF